MYYYEINLIIKPSGEIDYKGLDLSQVHGGSQFYDFLNGKAYLISEQDFGDVNFKKLTAEEYEMVKSEFLANQPKQPKSEIEILKEENEQLKNSLADLWEVVLIGGTDS